MAVHMCFYMSGKFSEWVRGHFFRIGIGHAGRFRYTGDYLDGKAVYYYDMDLGDRRVYEGLFRYVKKAYDYSSGKTVYMVRGNFCRNRRSGRWRFSRKNSHGKRILYVDYVNGMQTGLYHYKSTGDYFGIGLKGGSVSLVLSMRDGKPAGDVSGRFAEGLLTARFDDDGLPDGEWKMDMSVIGACRIDYEIWGHGTLVDAYSVDTPTGERHVHPVRIGFFLQIFIHKYCASLEGLFEKGTNIWSGDLGI